MEPTVLDPDALNLVKAIRQHESGGDFNLKGKSGETGAYQFTAPTWRGYAKEVLGDENAQMTPENQNKVAYTKIKKWKDEGKNVGEIASMWNAGEGRPKAYLENNVGTNKYGVHYDTPAYAKAVAEYYQHYKSNAEKPSPVPQTPIQPKQEQSLGEELGKRGTDIASGVSSLVGGREATGQGRLSGLLQTVGGVAGGIGDVVNKGLELIPGVKQVEGLIGKGVGKLAETETGKKVVGGIQKFSEEHPELSKDIGAVMNIATAIPILKGVGVVGNLAKDAGSSALKKVAEKSALKDFTATLNRTIAGRTALKTEGNDALKTLINERAIPDIADGKYNTQEAFSNLSQKISAIEDNELQPVLAQTSNELISKKVPLESLRKEALTSIKDEFKSSGRVGKAEAEINRIMDDYRNSYGDYVSLQDINDMKRGIRESVNFASPKLESDVSYHLGQAFMKNIEDSATKLGLPDIKAINQKMAKLIKAQKILKHIEDKPVKMGMIGETIKNAATVGGEIAGNATGIPLASTLISRQSGGFVGKKINGVTKGILDRTGKDAKRVTKDELKRKLGGLFGGAAIQKSTNQK